MGNARGQRRFLFPLYMALFVTFVALIFCQPSLSIGRSYKTVATDPWDKTQVLEPEQLARLLSSPGANAPRIVCVGFEFLYKGAHIPGAHFIGPGREAKGIEALKAWVRSIPRDQEVVLYCGCCPFKECPNIRPAAQALRELGLTRLKVLYLEDNFAKNWVDKGLPSEKGSENK